MFYDPLSVKKFEWFLNKYKCNTAIETGTEKGNGMCHLTRYLDHVITCEVDKGFYEKACEAIMTEGFYLQNENESPKYKMKYKFNHFPV